MHTLNSCKGATDRDELSKQVLIHELPSPFPSTRMAGSPVRETEIAVFKDKATISGSFKRRIVVIRNNPVLILAFNKRKEE